MPENHIMVDLETMNSTPDSAITSIGAVKFNLDKGLITDDFYVRVKLQSCLDVGLTIGADTIQWWLKQSEEARMEIAKPGDYRIEEALEQLKKWMGDYPVVWGNGAAFDNVILKNAYKAVGEEAPWPYWNDRCFRTLKALLPKIKFERKGAHIAVEDARYQAIYLMKALGVYGGEEKN